MNRRNRAWDSGTKENERRGVKKREENEEGNLRKKSKKVEK